MQDYKEIYQQEVRRSSINDNLLLQKRILLNIKDSIEGINKFSTTNYKIDHIDNNIVWQSGSTKVLAFNNKNYNEEQVVLLVPSLINRSYIFNLAADNSLADYLVIKNNKVFIIDWGEPQGEELDYSLDDFIVKKITHIINYLYTTYYKKIHLLGYCIGGILAIAANILNADKIKSLVLLATPWDFLNSKLINYKKFFDNYLPGYYPMSQAISKEQLNLLFNVINPEKVLRKFSRFNNLNANSQETKEFIYIENWLRDGISLPAKAARQILFNLYCNNDTFNNSWLIEGQAIDPAKINNPVLVIVADKDIIVAPSSALSITSRLKNYTLKRYDLGHIGLIVSKSAKDTVWQSLNYWFLLYK